MEKMYFVFIRCDKENENYYKGTTIKTFTNENEAVAYFRGLVDGIWGEPQDDDIDYLGRSYNECMKERSFASTDWLEIGVGEMRNGNTLYF